MGIPKSVKSLSSKKLYEIAKEKEIEEQNEKREKDKSKIKDLRAKKRKLTTKYKRDVASIDKKIDELAGKPVSRSKGKRSGDYSARLMGLINEAGRITTKELRGQLDKLGVPTDYLNQSLAYLKRKGLVETPERSVYTPK